MRGARAMATDSRLHLASSESYSPAITPETTLCQCSTASCGLSLNRSIPPPYGRLGCAPMPLAPAVSLEVRCDPRYGVLGGGGAGSPAGGATPSAAITG